MLGTIVGDVWGSCLERSCTTSRELPALTAAHHVTDDTVITMAVIDHLKRGVPLKEAFKDWVAAYPGVGYGSKFEAWAEGREPEAPVSWANGALMRIGPVAATSSTLEQARSLAADITSTTHGHPIAMTAVDQYVQLHWAALHGASRDELLQMWKGMGGAVHSVEAMHAEGSPMRLRADDTLEDVMSCLAESTDFDSLIGTCLYHGGDSDTIAAVAGVLGEALWDVPVHLAQAVEPYLDDRIRGTLALLGTGQ